MSYMAALTVELEQLLQCDNQSLASMDSVKLDFPGARHYHLVQH
jgi:hypothetical protein